MWRIALALVVFLAACSKDDSSKVIEILQGVEIVSRVSSITLQADTLVLSDVLSVKGDDKPSLTRYQCTGKTCTRSSQAGTPLLEPLLALADLPIDPGISYTKPGKHQGVDVAQYSLTSSRNGVDWTFTHYGGWLTHSAIETSIGSATDANGIDLNTAYSVSFGNNTGTSPAGDATWSGVMIGNTRHGKIEPIRGDANIAFTLGANADEASAVASLDVRFVNIRNLAAGNAHPDIIWPPVSVSADGTFLFQGTNGEVAGEFYGPDHAEVGGVFTRATAVGAFGARKN